MQKSKPFLSFLLACILLTLFSGQGNAAGLVVPEPGQSSAGWLDVTASGAKIQKCYPLDLVFLIDQSNSMMGNAYQNANDTLGNRVNSATYALNWLAENHINLCPNAVHRMGVISFGSTVQVDLPLTQIQPKDKDDWEAVRGLLMQNLQLRSMDNTDHALAFAEAKDMLDDPRNPPVPAGETRKRAIILLTDGMPCVPGSACGNDDKAAMNRYMERLVNQVESDFPFAESLLQRELAVREAVAEYGSISDIPDDVMTDLLSRYPVEPEEMETSTYIYILAMNDSTPYLSTVGSYFKTIAETHGGELVDLETNQAEVPYQFSSVLGKLAMVDLTTIGCGEVAVDPYLSVATFDAFANAEGIKITIEHNGHQITGNTGDTAYFNLETYEQNGLTNEHFVFRQPPAGAWIVTAASMCDQVRMNYQSFQPDVVDLVQPSGTLPVYEVGGKTYDENFPNYLRLQIRDNSGLPLRLDPNYPLDMQAKVTAPDGSIQDLTFEFDAGDDTWKSIEPLPVDQRGEYSVKVVKAEADCVTSQNQPGHCPPPHRFTIFDLDMLPTFTYFTGDVSTFSVGIVSPTVDEKVMAHGKLFGEKLALLPIVVTAGLTSNGQPLAYSQAMTDSAGLQAELFYEGASVATMPMTPNPENPLQFVAEFDNPDTISEKGQYEVVVSLVDPKKYNNISYRPEAESAAVSFTRYDPPLRNIFVLGGIALAIVLGIIAAIVAWVYDRSRSLRGQLVFASGNQTLPPMPIGATSRNRKFKLPPTLVQALGTSIAITNNGTGTQPYLKVRFPEAKLQTREFNMRPNSTIMVNGWNIRYEYDAPQSSNLSGPVRRSPLVQKKTTNPHAR